MVGFRDPNGALVQVSVLHRQVRLGVTHFPAAHVESDNVTTVPHHETTHAGGSVHQAATLPLTDMDLKRPETALVEYKGANLIVLIVPEQTKRNVYLYMFVPGVDHHLLFTIDHTEQKKPIMVTINTEKCYKNCKKT